MKCRGHNTRGAPCGYYPQPNGWCRFHAAAGQEASRVPVERLRDAAAEFDTISAGAQYQAVASEFVRWLELNEEVPVAG